MADGKEVNYLEMSDEELLNAPPPSLEIQEEAKETPVAEAADDGNEASSEQEEAAGEEEESAEEDDSKEEEGEDEGAKSAEASAEQAEEAEADEQPKSEQQDKEDKDKEAPKPEADEVKVDYEAEYKRLMAPFKANGRDITIKGVDDAITLMQMGANYNKKMAALKPNLKLMKMLENNGLLSEEKLSFLIDLDKKSPEAISKLVKDSGLDPMDLDAEKASGYKKSAYTVDEREIELDTVLDEIQGTESYNRTLEIVGTKWDSASKQVVAETPQLLKVINDHVDRGIYDIIIKEVESERLFGRLNGLSDIQAYRQVGDAIQARGGFNHLGSSQAKSQPQVPVITPPKPKQVDKDKLNDKRRAASSTRPAVPSSTPQDFNPLAMSDEEFSKTVQKQYL